MLVSTGATYSAGTGRLSTGQKGKGGMGREWLILGREKADQGELQRRQPPLFSISTPSQKVPLQE